MRISCRFARFLTVAFAVVIVLVLAEGHSTAAGIRPLVLDLAVNPGDTAEFELFLTPGDKQERVEFTLYRPVQMQNGNLGYEQADSKTYPPSAWVSLPKSAVSTPGQETRVAGSVRIPYDAAGSNIVVIMVEPEFAKKDTGVSLRVRYAVRLNIRVDRPGQKPSAQVSKLELARGEQGEPVVRALIRNASPMDYLTSAEATIRDSKKRLVERVEVKPEGSWTSNISEPRLYPYAEVLYYGMPKEPLPPGDYELRLFFRYASGLQITEVKSVQVKPGDFVYPKSSVLSTKVTPTEIEFEARAGAVTSKGIKVENRASSPIRVILEPAEIETDYPRSIFSASDVEVRNGASFQLLAGRAATVVLTARLPKDVAPGGYYGLLRVKSISPDGRLLEETTVDLAAIVPGKAARAVEVASLNADRTGAEALVSMVIRNSGDVRLSPKATLVLRPANGNATLTSRLTVEGADRPTVLPGRFLTLSGLLSGVAPGKYTAEIRVYEDEAQIGASSFEIVIK